VHIRICAPSLTRARVLIVCRQTQDACVRLQTAQSSTTEAVLNVPLFCRAKVSDTTTYYANKINVLRVVEVRRIKAACTTHSVRVSTNDHHTALRLSALEKAGCTTICTDEGVSGTTAQRPVLTRCLTVLHPRAFGVSGSRLPLTHAGKPSAPQAPTAVDACLCPRVPYERLRASRPTWHDASPAPPLIGAARGCVTPRWTVAGASQPW
jgi:Resolvase, N terminal domain